MRVFTLLCLILTAAGAFLSTERSSVTVHLLVDDSFSISSGGRTKMHELLRSLHEAREKHVTILQYAFGGETVYMGEVADTGDLSIVQERHFDRSRTDIEQALSDVLKRTPSTVNNRIVLVSDGQETSGRAERVIEEALERNVPIDVYATGGYDDDEVLVDHLILPPSVAAREPYQVRAIVSSTTETPARVDLYRNDLLISRRDVDLHPGKNTISFSGLVAGDDMTDAVLFEVRVTAEKDRFEQNNTAYGVVMTEDAADILIVARNTVQGERLASALENEGLAVTLSTPQTASLDASTLSRYRAVILIDIPAPQLSTNALHALADFVERGGGGLLAIGGPHSFGLGEYGGTALERILPVTTDVAQQITTPSLAMVLLLDTSGSMSDLQGGHSKLDLAKEASLGVLDLMHRNDHIGVINFDSVAHWIVPIQSVENHLAIASRIATLSAEGGTNLGAGLEAAIPELKKSEAAVKHLIALTDGRSLPADFETLTKTLREDGVTVSTVAVGRDADRELLEKIADWGDGRYYYTDDIRTIPQIFATETTVIARPIRADDPFQPLWYERAEFWDDATPLPLLGGYVLTTAKATANVHLRTEEDDPVLATWRQGLGRSVAFLSDMTGPWIGEWGDWTGYGPFVGQLVRWLMREAPSRELFTEVSTGEGTGRVTIDALSEQGAYINFLNLKAEVIGPGGMRFSTKLQQTDPGRYTAAFPADREGTYTIYIHDEREERVVANTGTVVPYPEEFRVMTPGTGLLQTLAAKTGGEILDDARPNSLRPLWSHPHPEKSDLPLAPVLLTLAFTLFFADIVLRYWPRHPAEEDGESEAEQTGEERTYTTGEELERRIAAATLRKEREEEEKTPPFRDRMDMTRTADAGRFLARRKKPDETDERDEGESPPT